MKAYVSKASNPIKLLCAVFCIAFILLSLISCGAANNEANTPNDYEYKKTIDELNKTVDGEYIIVSFPGLGIEPQMMNKLAFSIGNVRVFWYGIIITAGVLIAFVYAFFLSKREGIKTDDLFDMAIWSMIAAVVGARLYYVLTSLERFKGKFLDVFKIWEGGIAFYGAVIGGAIAVIIVCLIKKVNILKALDTVSPAVMIGQIIGRWGNFTNGEAFGYELREGSPLYFIRMGVYSSATRDLGESGIIYVHPTFLYESLWNLLGFVLINVLCVIKKKKFDGQVFFSYIAWYGFGRTFIELLRTDSLYIFGTIRISALVGCLCFFVGIAMMILFAVRGKKKRLASEAYESAYPMFRTSHSVQPEADADTSDESISEEIETEEQATLEHEPEQNTEQETEKEDKNDEAD